MKLSESLQLLNDLGITDWASKDTNEFTRLVINAAAEYLLESNDPFEFRPYIESDSVYNYFVDHSWELDWYTILSGSFIEAVELNINMIAFSINDFDPLMSVEDTKAYVELWVRDWESNVRTKLVGEIAKRTSL
ncbi:hypothetical protein [Denitrificimonas caeni]|uniref:hypothetical protein n=1 Tax=Denitrificimonas caeni TaxID=521720 RepID=UPI001966BBDC|nr:hypothetical protein [Denitrificimonas caeni]